MEVFNNLCQKNKTTMSYGGSCFRSSVGRFVSADIIVPDAKNPQSYNRFSYVFNNPLRYCDPTGHCAENGDEACWSYLESTFCNDGLCEPGEWERWIVAGGDSVWTIEELDLVRAALLQTKNALEANGFDWLAVLGDGWRFERFNMQRIPTFHDRTNSIYETELLPNGTSRQVLKGLQLSWYSGSKRIGLSDEAFGRPDIIGAIIHEIGHAVNYTHGGTLVSSFSSDPNFSTNVYSSSGQRNASEQWLKHLPPTSRMPVPIQVIALLHLTQDLPMLVGIILILLSIHR